MHRRVLIIAAFVTALLLIGSFLGLKMCRQNISKNPGCLFVNGELVSETGVIIYQTLDQRYATVPLVSVLKCMDCSIKWTSAAEAELGHNGVIFYLNTDSKTLYRENESTNLLQTPPGSRHYYCEADGQEVLLDTGTLRYVLKKFDLLTTVHIDINSKKVSIDWND